MESAPSKAAGRAAEGMASLQSATAAQFAVCGVEEMAKSWKLFPLDAIGVMTKMMFHTTTPLKSLLSYKPQPQLFFSRTVLRSFKSWNDLKVETRPQEEGQIDITTTRIQPKVK